MKLKNLKQSDIDELMQPMAMDLLAMFKVLKDEVMGIIADGGDPEKIIEKIDTLFGETNE